MDLLPGVIKEANRLFTVIPGQYPTKTVYGERIVSKDGRALRVWSPYRSKLAAAILKRASIEFSRDYHVLYLGAATGTTVSHLSDILTEGTIYAVEISSFAMQRLVALSRERNNIIPILADAFHPERYSNIISDVDVVYQDISQRNQVDIFIKNCNLYLKEKGYGIIMIKARSIDVNLKPTKIYKMVKQQIIKDGYEIVDYKNLNPYAKDHACMVVRRI